MKYKNIIEGLFISRPNRFIAKVIIDGKEEIVHVKNTGRCKELLVPGSKVYLEKSDNLKRKTKYDLISVEKETNNGIILINMDSQIPNDVAGEYLKQSGIFSETAIFKREVMYSKSRFDYYVEDGNRKAFIEVKGVTLENDGVVLFPDAPTERGVKHINELIKAKKEGYEAYILFIIQMGPVKLFKPNDNTHKEFGEALRTAKKNGVEILAIDCRVSFNSIVFNEKIPVYL